MSKLEDHFKDSLHRAVANEPPVVDAWDRFERRARRDRRVRFAGALAGVAVIAAASALAIPRLLPDRAPVITQPTESPTPDPYAGWETFTNTDHSYNVKVPPGWRVTSFEDVYEILPDGLPGTSEGERTFAVSIAFFMGAPPDEPRAQTGASTGVRPDRRGFKRSEIRGSDGSRSVRYEISWDPSTSCVYGDPIACARYPNTLVVHIFASDLKLWDRYAATGEQVIASLEHLTGPVS